MALGHDAARCGLRPAACARQVPALADLDPRPLEPGEVVLRLDAGEVVLRLDEKTSRQPRTRRAPTRPARGGQPGRVAHASKRGGALNLFAAFDTRRGPVYAATAPRRRQVEFSAVRAVRAQLDREIPAALTTIHLVVDNGRLPTGAVVRAWLAAPPRFCGPVPPVHGSWMNQGDQWFSMLPRKRLRCADVADLAHLAARLQAFVTAWHQHAHPFQWSRKSVATVMAPCERPLAKAA